MTESATRQNMAAETLNPSSALLSSARRTFSGTPPAGSHLLDPTLPPPPLTPVSGADPESGPGSLGGTTFSAAGFADAAAAAGSSPERSFAMVTADSFCGEPIGDAWAEEAFGGVGGVESSVWVSARARVMLPDSLADSAASCSDLASDDAAAGGGSGAGAGEGLGGERGGDVSSGRGRGGEASALGGSGGGGGVGGCGGEDGEESPGL